VAGHDFEVLVTGQPIAVLILDPRIREVNVSVVVRQVVLASPTRDLLRLAVRPPIAILLASIALVQETLVVALELVIEDNAVHPTALLANALLSALVGTIDLGVVRQLARLPEARVKRLTWLPGALVPLVPIRLEQVSAAICQHHGAVIRAERGGAYQTFPFKVAHFLAGVATLISTVVQVTVGDDAEGANGGEDSAFGAVDLVHAVALSHWPALTAAWQIQVPREHIARVAVGRMIAFAAPATAAAASVAEVVAVAVI
jgi:hypothetical protein